MCVKNKSQLLTCMGYAYTFELLDENVSGLFEMTAIFFE